MVFFSLPSSTNGRRRASSFSPSLSVSQATPLPSSSSPSPTGGGLGRKRVLHNPLLLDFVMVTLACEGTQAPQRKRRGKRIATNKKNPAFLPCPLQKRSFLPLLRRKGGERKRRVGRKRNLLFVGKSPQKLETARGVLLRRRGGGGRVFAGGRLREGKERGRQNWGRRLCSSPGEGGGVSQDGRRGGGGP